MENTHAGTVYVGTREYKLGRMKMYHVMSGMINNLHGVAFLLGVDEKHFQDKPNRPHYDICKSKKLEGIKKGWLVELNDKEIIKKLYH